MARQRGELLTAVEAALLVAAILADLAAVTLVEITSANLEVPVLAVAGFVQPRIRMGALILLVEVSADQPVRSDTTTEAAARLLLGRINSADGETNR